MKENKNETKTFVIFNSWGSIGFLALLYSKTLRKLVLCFISMILVEVFNKILFIRFHNNNISLIMKVIEIIILCIFWRIIGITIKNKIKGLINKK